MTIWLITALVLNLWPPLQGVLIFVSTGMWGGRNSNLNLTEGLRKEFIKKGYCKGSCKSPGKSDQDLLREILWPIALNDSISHGSFTCKMFPNTRPFPTRLKDISLWVGHSYQWKGLVRINYKCPIECRPKDHPDWEYC